MTSRWNFVLGVLVIVLLVAVLVMQLTGSPMVRAAAASVSAAQEPAREITVTGQGAATAQPDMARASIGVQVIAPTVAQATQENETQMAEVIAKLKGLGVAAKDIQTTNYSIFPQRNFQNGNSGEITGYQVSDTVQVTIRDLSTVGTVLDQVTQAGANNVFGVTFGASDQTTLQSEAIDKAVADARTRAEELAKASGVQLGDVVSISQAASATPIQFAQATTQTAGGSVPIQPGTVEVNAQVQISYAIK
jgi:uncharacterized protein YggE